MATDTSANRMDAPFGRETTVRSQKQKDILTQISDMYQKKQRPQKKAQCLVPTKATLFGLDVRFRHIDQKIADEKAARSLSKLRINDRQNKKSNRHSIPIDPNLLQPKSSAGMLGPVKHQWNARKIPKDKKGTSLTNYNSTQKLWPSVGDGAFNTTQQSNQCPRKPQTTVPGQRSKNGYATSIPPTSMTLDQSSVKGKSTNNLISNGTNQISSPPSGGVTISTILPKIDEAESIFKKLKTEVYSFSAQNSVSVISKKRPENEIVALKSLEAKQKAIDYGSCYDSILKEKLYSELPKTQSYVKFSAQRDAEERRKIGASIHAQQRDAEEQQKLLEKNSKKNQKSPRELGIANVKKELKQVGERIKTQQNQQQQAERDKVFKGANAQGSGQQGEGTAENEKSQIQVIERARLFFADDQVQSKAEELGFEFIQVEDKDTKEVTTAIPEWDHQIEMDLREDLKNEADGIQAEINQHIKEQQELEAEAEAENNDTEKFKRHKHAKNSRQVSEGESDENGEGHITREEKREINEKIRLMKKEFDERRRQSNQENPYQEYDQNSFDMSMFYSEGFTAEEDLQRQKRNREEIGNKKLKTLQAPDKSGRSNDEDQIKVQESLEDTYNQEQEKMNYLQKNNFISDNFLFGEDIELDQYQYKLNKYLKKNKPNKMRYTSENSSQYSRSSRRPKSNGAPRICNMQKKSAGAATSDRRNITMQNQEPSTILPDFNKKSDPCAFPKTMNYQNKDIHINVKRLMSKVKTIESLSKEDLLKLKQLKEKEIEKFQKVVEDRFDSNKNWSIMINQKDNETRNQIMQWVKLEQLKRRCLHDFSRKTREDLLIQNKERKEKALLEKGEQIINNEDQYQLKGDSISPADKEKKKLVKEYKNDFLSYFEMKLTKAGADLGDPSRTSAPMASSGNQMKLPKRPKAQRDDSVESIAQNVQSLIRFGKEQSQIARDFPFKK